MSNLIGQSLGRYHILEQLGEGGMAVVYKAFDTRLETDVAVKVIRTENFTPLVLARALKRFEREAKALARLTHPNIVKVTDYGEYENQPYLVMPYLPGGNLKQFLHTKGYLPWQEAVHLLLPIAQALEFAHSQGVIHRDVKPANILLTQSGQPMLTDFGVAKVVEEEATVDLTGTAAAVGTPEYMAPEQTGKNIDHRVDIYALGIVLYEMVSGRRPYEADTPLAVLVKQASEPLPRPSQFVPGLPEAVEKVLIKALAKKPEDRYQSMGEFTAALEKTLTGSQPFVISKKEEKKVELEKRVGPPTSTKPERLTDRPNMKAGPTSLLKRLIPIGILLVFLVISIPVGLYLSKLGMKGVGPLGEQATHTAVFTMPISPTRTLAITPTHPLLPTPTLVPTLVQDLGGRIISVAVENAYPPFNSIDQATGQGVGWDYDAVREICKRLNCVADFKQAAWDGIFPAMQAGEFDMLADGVTVTSDRAKIVDFSTPYVEVNQYLMVRTAETRTPEQMKADPTAKIGTQIGTTNEIAAKAYFTGKTIQDFEDFGAAVLALKSSDIDGVVIDNIAAIGFMNENKGVFKMAGQIATGETLAFVFPQNSTLEAPVNAALAAMTADGTLEQLNKKWKLIP